MAFGVPLLFQMSQLIQINWLEQPRQPIPAATIRGKAHIFQELVSKLRPPTMSREFMSSKGTTTTSTTHDQKATAVALLSPVQFGRDGKRRRTHAASRSAVSCASSTLCGRRSPSRRKYAAIQCAETSAMYAWCAASCDRVRSGETAHSGRGFSYPTVAPLIAKSRSEMHFAGTSPR